MSSSTDSKAEAELEYHKKTIKFPIDKTKDEEVLASIIKAEKPDKYDVSLRVLTLPLHAMSCHAYVYHANPSVPIYPHHPHHPITMS